MRGLKIHHEVIEWVGSRTNPYWYKSIIIIIIIIIVVVIIIMVIIVVIIMVISVPIENLILQSDRFLSFIHCLIWLIEHQ